LIYIFPLREILRAPDGSVSCSCSDGAACRVIGKHPAVIGWADGTYWNGLAPQNGVVGRRGPGGGFGLTTGVRNNLLVIDTDVKAATATTPGIDGVANLLAMGPLPQTRVIQSPSGGVHFYFTYPEGFNIRNSVSILAPGVDVRGEGGMVVGEGSPHKRGGLYKVVVDVEAAPLPLWLLERLRVIAQRDASPARESSSQPTIDPDSPEGLQAVAWAREYLDKAPPAIEGQDGSGTLFSVACRLMYSSLPLETLQDLIEESYNSRCVPPWSPEEIEHKLEDADRMMEDPRGLPPEGIFDRMKGLVAPPPRAGDPGAPPDAPFGEDNCGRPVGETSKISFANLVSDLRYKKEWVGVLRFDDLRKWITCVNPPIALDAQRGNITTVDYSRIRAWFERNGKKATKEDVADAVELVARESRYNPVLMYLDALPPVTIRRNGYEGSTGTVLDQLAARALGNTDPLAQDVLVKTLIAAVRRMRYPGTKVDTVLVLRGLQSKRKSTFLVTLFGEEYVKSQMADLSNKDASVGLRGMWAVELAELDRIIRAESSTVKEFLSRAIDSYRPPYGRTEEQFPRQCVFFGTTNDDNFLVDVTGNRRFWVIEVTEFDLKWVAVNRDAIWAAVCALEKAGVPHWFEDEAKAAPLQSPYEYVDGWEAPIRDYCAGRARVSSAADIFTEVIAKGDASALLKLDKRSQNRIAGILRKLGCEAKRSHGKYWIEVPLALQQETPSDAEIKRRAAVEAVARVLSATKAPN
jgi:predicted P-loop ATPase